MAGWYCNFNAAILLFIGVFTKACKLTVLLGCFVVFFIDLALQVPCRHLFFFSSIVTSNPLALKEFLGMVKL